ncbi:MAG: hypothetical protein KDD47_00395, partial [Acidobacteria bacterium]|nr:hypothetical protein [Acidobacteriota bacterium]
MLVCLGFGLGAVELPAQESGIVGDADGNGVFDLADARYLEAYLAAGAEMAASPGRLSDVASPCDGPLDGADVERLVRAGRQARQRASRSTPVVSECHGVVIGEPPPDLHAGGEEIPTLDDLYLAIAGEIPHFAGFYLDGDVPTVALTDPRDEVLEAARQALLEVFGAERLERGATFRAVAAEYGFAELQEQRLRIRPLLALPEVVGLDLDERRNRLVVNFRDEADLPRVAALLAADGVPEGMWVAEPGTLEPQGRFQAKARPLRGGRRVELPGTWWCTMGPVVDLAGVRGWLTNTHCSAIFGVQESSKIAQAAANDGLAGVETVDPFFGPGAPFSECEGHPCRWSDSAFFSTDLAEGRVPSWKGVVEAELQSPSGLTRRFITSVVDHPIDGEEVCKSGQKTEFTCGEVNK